MTIIVIGMGTEFQIGAYKAFGMFDGVAYRDERSSSRQKGTL